MLKRNIKNRDRERERVPCLFIFGCTGSSLFCSGSLWLQRAGPPRHCGAQAPRCGGLSVAERGL